MLKHNKLKDFLQRHVLPNVQGPAQYLGGELNMVRKDHAAVRGKLCLAFPDAYSIGMSHHGLQVLYTLMNGFDDWVCERAFTPWDDMEAELRRTNLPLYSLETFTPLYQFDVLGFTLQYEICSSNLLTMLDLGRIPLHAHERTMSDPLVIAGGPCAQNPEPMAPFIDVFVTGDGEPELLATDNHLGSRYSRPTRSHGTGVLYAFKLHSVRLNNNEILASPETRVYLSIKVLACRRNRDFHSSHLSLSFKLFDSSFQVLQVLPHRLGLFLHEVHLLL